MNRIKAGFLAAAFTPIVHYRKKVYRDVNDGSEPPADLVAWWDSKLDGDRAIVRDLLTKGWTSEEIHALFGILLTAHAEGDRIDVVELVLYVQQHPDEFRQQVEFNRNMGQK
jgi:hypothetical protein